jgi:hypothetical protein
MAEQERPASGHLWAPTYSAEHIPPIQLASVAAPGP